jgi:hypothetical protein
MTITLTTARSGSTPTTGVVLQTPTRTRKAQEGPFDRDASRCTQGPCGAADHGHSRRGFGIDAHHDAGCGREMAPTRTLTTDVPVLTLRLCNAPPLTTPLPCRRSRRYRSTDADAHVHERNRAVKRERKRERERPSRRVARGRQLSSRFLSVDMNCDASLKSRYTDAKRTNATLSTWRKRSMRYSPIFSVGTSRSGLS